MIRSRVCVGIEWRPEGARVVRLEHRPGRVRVRDARTVLTEGDAPFGERLRGALGQPPADATVVGFPARRGFLRRLELPARDRTLLRQMLELDLDRHLPLPADKVAFDFALLGKGEAGRWHLLLAALPKTVLETAIAPVQEAGAAATGATLCTLALQALAEWSGAPDGSGLVMECASGHLRAEVIEAGRPVWRGERAVDTPPSATREAVRALGDEAWRAATPRWGLWLGEGLGEPFLAWAREVGLVCVSPLRRLRVKEGAWDPAFTTAAAVALTGLRQGPWSLNLVAPAVPLSRHALLRRAAAALLLAGVGLGGGVWTAGLVRDRMELASSRARIQALAPGVRRVEEDAKKVAAMSRLATVMAQGNQEISKVKLLQDLAALVPKNTWLTTLTYRHGEVELSGYSTSAQELIPRLEASPLIKQAGFSGGIELERGRERFTIRATLR